MDLIDSKYIGLVSSRLQKFKRVKTNLYNFRCPICGDSQRNKNRARGYIYPVKNNTNFKCHNCGASLSFNNFLKEIDPILHKQYTLEKFKEGFTGKNFVVEEPKLEFKQPAFKKKLSLPKASEDELAKKYLMNRRLDPDRFYYAEKFKEWTNTQIHTFDEKSLKYEESRIVIPLLSENGDIFGFQGRALGPSKIKYITVILDDSIPKVYGLDRVRKNETIYVTEGPFDSTFVQNAIAMCGSDILLDSFNLGNDIVYVLDNEPRNKEICSRIEKLINRGEKVVIWPRSIIQKDINEMFLYGHQIMDVLKSNTYKGLEAKVKFNEWKKV